jgi:hypothetical protein
MSGISSAIPSGKQWRKKRDWRMHQRRKRPYFKSQLSDEESWTRPKPDHVFITHQSISGGKLALEEGDIVVMDENFSEDGEFQFVKRFFVQLKSSDYLKLSETGLISSAAVLSQYRKAVEVLRSHIVVAMPGSSSRGNFGTDALRRLLHESIANPLAEIAGGLKCMVGSDWLDDPTRILDRLESQELSVSEQRKAIAHAESLAFTGSELERLLAFYDGWIEARRFTEEDEEITAVCAAIRKYCMNMDSNRYSRYAGWLVPSTTARVHQDVDLELAKGAYWHLRYVATESDERLRVLQTVLADEACDYMKPRLMLDKNYASITKFAIIACLLIDARQGSDEGSRRVWSRKADLSMAWFDRLVKFELGKAVESIGKRDMEFASRLNELVETLDRKGD